MVVVIRCIVLLLVLLISGCGDQSAAELEEPSTESETSDQSSSDIVNNAPSFTHNGSVLTLASNTAYSQPAWASAISDGDEAVEQVLHFEVISNSNPSLFSVQPTISYPSGTLIFTPNGSQAGSSDITIVLKDDGGTNNAGNDTSEPYTFSITVTPPVLNHSPTNVSVTGYGKITVNWTNVVDASSYNIYVSTQPNIVIGASGVTQYSNDENPFSITEVIVGTTYYVAVTAVVDGVESELSSEVDAVSKAQTVGQGKLNDTGITWGGSHKLYNNTTCVGVTVGQQDCSFGRDVTHYDDSDGHAGFSYTKLDSDGGDLPASATAWDCVRDNVTGLIWERKKHSNSTRGEGLHDADDRFNWYSTDTSNNGGSVGYQDDDGNICTGYASGSSTSYCNTQAFVARVNAAELCGANDWRMPDIDELHGLVNNDVYNPAIDTNFFPDLDSVMHVWSGSPLARNSNFAQYLSFSVGSYYYGGRDDSRSVRLVRVGE